MAKVGAEVDSVKMMQSFLFTVKIKRKKELGIRLFIGRQLLILAARVMNCNIVIESNTDERL